MMMIARIRTKKDQKLIKYVPIQVLEIVDQSSCTVQSRFSQYGKSDTIHRIFPTIFTFKYDYNIIKYV